MDIFYNTNSSPLADYLKKELETDRIEVKSDGSIVCWELSIPQQQIEEKKQEFLKEYLSLGISLI